MNRVPLNYWIHQVLGQSQAQVKLRLRGNNLHVLCEGNPCPDAEVMTQRFRHAIAQRSLDSLVPPNSPPIYRVIMYGRVAGHSQPVWSRSLTLGGNPASNTTVGEAEPVLAGDRATLEREAVVETPEPLKVMQPEEEASAVERSEQSPQPEVPASESPREVPTVLELAQQGEPDAIARYLSYTFSPQGIAVRVKVDSPLPDTSFFANRLLVLCESAYVPNAALLAEPIAQQLRELELAQFRDAIIFGQVCGESRPEWVLRVDLTPPDEILKEWARWGDVQAISRLLNRCLAAHQIQLTALLKDSTLHLSCAAWDGAHGSVPDKLATIAAIAPLLQSLSAQGIHAATIYGVSDVPANSSLPDVAPAWVYWLDLPAASQTDLAASTLAMAHQGDLSAITFLLVRLLNPDLDTKLATGGIRVQLRQKGDLLHVMTDALNCPRQEVVAPAIGRLLKPLGIASITGVRVYGRRSGQKHPLWHYGTDFISRNRITADTTPEFAASAAHVDELLSPPGAIVPWAEVMEDEEAALQGLYASVVGKLQRSLVQTQLFAPTETAVLGTGTGTDAAQSPVVETQQNWKIACLWGTVGVLLVLQIDWVLGAWVRLNSQATAIAPPVTAPAAPAPTQTQLPSDLLNQPRIKDWNHADGSTFTQPGSTVIDPTAADASDPSTTATPLPASPFQAKGETVIGHDIDFPTFNSRQLDGQIALYRKYLELNGPPDVLVVGSSRALRGVDPVALETALADQGYEGIQVFNLGVNGATAQVVDVLVRQVLPQDNLPKLILFADGGRAFNSGRQDITFNGIASSQGYQALLAGNPPIPSTIVAQTPKAAPTLQDGKPTSVTEESPASVSDHYQTLDQSLNQRVAGLSTVYRQRDRLKTRLREQIVAWLPDRLNAANGMIASSEELLNSSSPVASAANSASGLANDGQHMVDIDGFLPLSVRFNPTTYYQKYARVSGDYDSDYEAFVLNGIQTEAMISLARYAQLQKIPLVFVNLPLTQEYLDPARKRYETEFQQKMLALAPQINLLYRDLSGALTTQPQYFSDPSHLNRYGAYEVSRRLAQDVMIPWQLAR